MELLSSTDSTNHKAITVFTPTYNRAKLIRRVYDSLVRQTNQQFKWLVIDDGSTDDTKTVIHDCINENKIEISYVYKENGGLHTGYNAAIERLDTELSICVDSDDWLPDDAIERILKVWNERKADDIAGLIGLDYTAGGDLIGDHLPDGASINPIDLLASKTNHGDKKYVVRTDCYKKVAPMPEFAGEKNFNPHYMILKLSADYQFVAVDAPLCIVDYQPDGMTANQFKQYVNSPRSYAELRRVIMGLPRVPAGYLLKTTIHYCSSSQLSRNRSYIRESPKPLLTLLCTPAGWLLTAYIRRSVKRSYE